LGLAEKKTGGATGGIISLNCPVYCQERIMWASFVDYPSFVFKDISLMNLAVDESVSE
jgi:hypothetical protein